MASLLPIPAPLPRGAWGVLAVLALTAMGLVAPGLPGLLDGTGGAPGDPRLPYGPVTVNLHWQVHAHGLAGFLADDLHGFPLRTDRLVTDGFPLDALASAPLCALLGLERGLTAWIALALWAVGAGAAWLAMRWWGTRSAGLVAGVGFQVGEALVRALGEGRSTGLLAAAALPFALGFGVEAARSRRAPVAAAAGAMAGLGALIDPSQGPVLGLAAIGPLLAALARDALLRARLPAPAEGGPDAARAVSTAAPSALPALLLAVAGLAVPLAPWAAWVAAGHGELPSLGMDPWAETVLGLRTGRPVDHVAGRIVGVDGVGLGTLARPVLLVAVALGLRTGRPRHWGPALAFAALAAVLGLGAELPGPVVAPWGWLQALPGLGRLWWADRSWIAVALGLSLVAAGGALRAGPLLAVLLYAEAWALSPALPLPFLPTADSDAARVLAAAPGQPLVLLPTGGGPYRTDRFDLLDQTRHGRPMANGTRLPLDLTGPDAVRRAWSENPGLAALLACELGDGGRVSDAGRAAATAALTRAGLRDVYLDPRYVGDDPAYPACVAGVLAGWERREEPPLVRFHAP